MRASWNLAEWVGRFLEAAEREAVLGDLAEAAEGPWHAFTGIVGLVFRRQAALWTNWRPWVAAFGVSVPTSFMLMGNSVMLCARCVTLAETRAAGQLYPAQIEVLAVQALLLAGWSWTCGYFVGSISRRTVWFSVIAYASPCLFCLSRFRIESLSKLSLLLFVLPLAFGLLQGLKDRRVRFGVSAAAIITALAIIMRVGETGGAGNAFGWACSLAQTWPAWCLAVAASNTAKFNSVAKRPTFETERHEPS
jgi:hypothetical protein